MRTPTTTPRLHLSLRSVTSKAVADTTADAAAVMALARRRLCSAASLAGRRSCCPAVATRAAPAASSSSSAVSPSMRWSSSPSTAAFRRPSALPSSSPLRPVSAAAARSTSERRWLSTKKSPPPPPLQSSSSSSASSSSPKSTRVLIERVGSPGIVRVKLNRPEKRNGLDLEMFQEVCKTAASLRDDPSVRVVIISGEGEAFCAGMDFKRKAEFREWQQKSIMSSHPRASVDRLLRRPSGYGRSPDSPGNLAQDAAWLWREVPCPVVAAIHGACYGGGLQIALGADFRIASPDAKLSFMEARWGLIPDMAASVALRELVRIDVAKELAMTGRKISGTEAAALGLVTRVADDPIEEATRLAEEIAERSPEAAAATKHMFQETFRSTDEAHCLLVETECQLPLLGRHAASAPPPPFQEWREGQVGVEEEEEEEKVEEEREVTWWR